MTHTGKNGHASKRNRPGRGELPAVGSGGREALPGELVTHKGKTRRSKAELPEGTKPWQVTLPPQRTDNS